MTTPLLSNKTHLLRLFTATFLLALFALASCNKDDDESPLNLLTTGTWNYDNIADIQPPGVVDGSELDSLFQGFKITFNSDGTYSGETPADPGDPTFNGNWGANEAVTEIYLDPGTADEQTLTVIFLNASSLQMTFNFEIDGTTGATAAVTINFRH